MSALYCCPVECPGKIPQPFHIPGYAGHIPTKRARNGSTFGRMSRDVIEDPCIAQAPCPILAPPSTNCCPEDCCMKNPVGCQDIGCCDPVCCPPPRVYTKPKKPPCPEMCCDPCEIMKCFPGQSPDCCQPSPAYCCPSSNRQSGCGSSRGGGMSCGSSGGGGCGGGPRMNFNLSGGGGGGGCGGGPRVSFNSSGGGGGGCGGGQRMSCGSACPPSCPCPVNLGAADCEFGRTPCCRPSTPPCPPKPQKHKGCFEEPQRYFPCGPNPAPECSNYEVRAHHLNRGPYACPCKPDPDCQIYRCCEPMSASYAGHIPGFTFHSTSRTTGKASWGTKQYMNKCFYFNTWSKP